MDADVVLAAASALHAGFQLTVTAVVYPAFAGVPLDAWPAHHATHSRRILVPVGLVYAAVLIAGAAAVMSHPGPLGWTAVLANGAALLVTATVAAPAHGRLSPDRDPVVLHRLIVADRVRTGCAVVAALAAVSAR